MRCSKYVIVPIAVLTLIAEMSFGQGSTITTLSTKDTPGTTTTVTVAGATASSLTGQTLTLNYLGGFRTLSSYATSQGTLSSIQVSSAVFLRRNPATPTPSNNVLWNYIVSSSGNTFNLGGPFVGQESAAYGGRDLNFFVGTDNIFGNVGDTNGNNNNIQRVDSIFSATGITVNKNLAFAVFERGPTNGHDGFKIAAITGLDANGNPTSYGPLISLATGTWGTTSLGPLNTLVTRNEATQPLADSTHPSANVQGQVLGGVSLNVITDLGIPAGGKIFGYSLFAADIPATANLVNFNSFPTNTNSGGAGGIDLLAYNGVLYLSVPGNPGPTTDWALPANGNFSDPTNWLGNTTPKSTDTAIINNGTTATLTGGSASVNNLDTGVGYSNANGNVVVDGGTLSAAGTIATGVDGTGSMTITNAGKATSGTNTTGQNPGSSGTTNINGPGSNSTSTGNTTIGDGGNGTLNITNGGTSNATNTTIANQPGSTGIATVDGSGSQLNNTGTLNVGPAGTGVINLTNGGTATANGGTTVGPNGMIMGNGTITTPTLINNGTVAPTGPNGTAGTLTQNGNYQQGPTGTLDAEVGGPQQADQLKVNGTASLNGTLALTSSNNFHPSPGDTYTILTASGGVTGKFTNVVDTLNNSGLTQANVVAPNGLVVSYVRPAPTPATVTVKTPDPVPAGQLTAGQKNAILVPALNPDIEQLAAPFDIWFSLANTQRFNLEARFDDVIAGSTGFVSNVTYPTPPPTGKEVTEGKGVVTGKETKEAPPLPRAAGCRWGVWVTGYGDFVDVDDDGLAKGYNYTTGGVTVGIDYRVTDHFVVGLMGGYAHTWTDLKPSGSVDVNTGWGGLYAGYFNQGFYVLGAAFGGGNSFDTSRAALLGGRADGSSDSQEFSTFLSAGYDFHFGHLTIGPTAAVQYSNVNINGFSENSSVAPVAVSEDSEESWRSDLGFRAWYNFQVGRIGVRPFVRAAWEHEYKESRLPISAHLVDIPGSPVTVFGPSLGHDSAVINAGVAVQWTPCISTYVSYDGQLGRDRYASNGVSGGFRISF